MLEEVIKKAQEVDQKDLEKNFLKELRDSGFEIADNCICLFSFSAIIIGIKSKRYEISSEVRIFFNDKCYIDYSSSSRITPENKAAYWRTIHAASFLKNWEVFTKIVKKYIRITREAIIINNK